jgi:hypothetical protein
MQCGSIALARPIVYSRTRQPQKQRWFNAKNVHIEWIDGSSIGGYGRRNKRCSRFSSRISVEWGELCNRCRRASNSLPAIQALDQRRLDQ